MYTDGQVITIGNERSRCLVIIQSSPSLIGKGSQVIHELTYDSITECDVYIRRNLFSNGILSGGTRIQYVIDVQHNNQNAMKGNM